jgi:hypothetical protein
MIQPCIASINSWGCTFCGGWVWDAGVWGCVMLMWVSGLVVLWVWEDNERNGMLANIA